MSIIFGGFFSIIFIWKQKGKNETNGIFHPDNQLGHYCTVIYTKNQKRSDGAAYLQPHDKWSCISTATWQMILHIYSHMTNDPVYLQSQDKRSCISTITRQMILHIYNHKTNDPAYLQSQGKRSCISTITRQMILHIYNHKANDPVYLQPRDKWSCIYHYLINDPV